MKKLRLSKNLLSSLFLLVVALVICVPLWLHGTIWGHDLGFHLYRFAGLENAIRGGQIVPQVDSELLYGAGYGFSLFYGPLAAYMALLGKIISGGSWIWGVNLMIFGCVYGGGLAMAKMVNEISKKRYLGLMVAMVYMLAPYHLTDIYVRSAFGELPTFFLAPMLWLGLWRLIEKKEKYLLWTVLGMAGMLLSHNLSVFIFGLIAGGYLLINIKKLLYIKVINRLLLSAVVALGVSAFFWVPFGELKMASNYNIWQKNYQEVIMAQNGDFFNFGALTLRRLFWDDKVTGGASNVMAFGIGLAAMAGLVGFWPLSKKMEKEERDLGRAMWILGVGSMLLTTNLIPWERMPSVFYMMQFPWRMLLAGSFCLSIVAGLVIYYLWSLVPRQREAVMAGAIWVTLGVLLLGSSKYLVYALEPDWTMREWRHDYKKDKWGTAQNSWMTQYVPVKMNRVEVNMGADRLVESMEEWLRDKGPEVVGGGGAIIGAEGRGMERKGLRMKMLLLAGEGTQEVELPLAYYPGYKSNMGEVGESENGLVLVRIEGMEWGETRELEVWYGMSRGTVVGLVISLGTVVVLGVNFPKSVFSSQLRKSSIKKSLCV